ncbi:MAG: OmpH family outer membrane protein [Nitrospirota bacterium]
MKKIAMLLFIIFLLPVSLLADDTIMKIGVVDIQKALNESEAGKKAKSDLEALIKSKQSVIDEKKKALEKLKGEIEKQTSILSAEAKKNKEADLERLLREYQRTVQDSQDEVKKKEAELTNSIIKEVREIVEKFSSKEKYAIIVEKGIVIYSNEGIDITDTVIKKYNESKKK